MIVGSGKPSASQASMAEWPMSAVAFTSACRTLIVGATGGRKKKIFMQNTLPTLLLLCPLRGVFIIDLRMHSKDLMPGIAQMGI